MRILTALGLATVLSAASPSAKIIYRQPLDEAGQSGVCLHGDKLFLTMHSKLEGRMKGGFFFNGDVLVVQGDVIQDISILEDRKKFLAVLQGGALKAGRLAPKMETTVNIAG